MHERERHRIILAEIANKPVATVTYLVELLDASEATIRRDINYLDESGNLKKVRGGAESLHPPTSTALAGRPFSISQSINIEHKRQVAKMAASLCKDGESVIIGGGSTSYMMAEHLKSRQLHVMTNSFVIAEYLLKNGQCRVTLPAGKVYRDHYLILSPFEEDGSNNFFADKMFFGGLGVGPLGVMETDPLIVQGMSRLLGQAEKKVLLVDSSKFSQRSSMIFCALSELDIVITDEDVDDKSSKMITEAGCQLMIAGDSTASG